MAQYESRLYGDFDEILQTIDNKIIGGSISASIEGACDFQDGDVRLAVRVYERFSYIGANRLSLNISLLQNKDKIFISVITSGGSQAMFFKINTIGENAFLKGLLPILENYSKPKQ